MNLNDSIKARIQDDVSRNRIKKLCEYIKSRESLTKYKVLSGVTVSFMDEIRLGGVTLTVLDEIITEYEGKLNK